MAKNKKPVIILLAVVMVIIITAATTFIMMSMQEKKKNDPVAEKPTVRETYSLGEFIVNVTHERGYRFIKADMTLLIMDKKIVPRLDQEKAQIRDTVIQILRKSGRELIDDPEARDLKCQIKDSIDAILGSTAIEDVYFTDFVIQ